MVQSFTIKNKHNKSKFFKNLTKKHKMLVKENTLVLLKIILCNKKNCMEIVGKNSTTFKSLKEECEMPI